MVKARQSKEALRQKGQREKLIEELLNNRLQLYKRWRKAAPEEKAGLKLLRDELKQTLVKLHRAEQIRRRRKRKEKETRLFFQDHLKYSVCCWTKSEAGNSPCPRKTWSSASRANAQTQSKIHH